MQFTILLGVLKSIDSKGYEQPKPEDKLQQGFNAARADQKPFVVVTSNIKVTQLSKLQDELKKKEAPYFGYGQKTATSNLTPAQQAANAATKPKVKLAEVKEIANLSSIDEDLSRYSDLSPTEIAAKRVELTAQYSTEFDKLKKVFGGNVTMTKEKFLTTTFAENMQLRDSLLKIASSVTVKQNTAPVSNYKNTGDSLLTQILKEKGWQSED
jgi:hypothetical protein